MTGVLNDLLLFSCLAAFVTGVVIAAATILICYRRRWDSAATCWPSLRSVANHRSADFALCQQHTQAIPIEAPHP